MNLILHSLSADLPTLHKLAALVAPQQCIEISAHALRCLNVAQTDQFQEQKQQLDILAAQAQTDVYWSAASASLSDYKLLAMDMDSTLITIECIDEIADMQGLKPQVAAITEAAMRGEIAFSESLTRRVALLAGLSATALQQVYDQRLQLSLGAESMLRGIQAAGIKTQFQASVRIAIADGLKMGAGLDANAELFLQFSLNAGTVIFIGALFAAGKFPNPTQMVVVFALGDQELAALLHHPDTHDFESVAGFFTHSGHNPFETPLS